MCLNIFVYNALEQYKSHCGHDGNWGTELAVEIAYGATADQGVKVHVLRAVDDAAYESAADAPFSFEMPATISTTHRRTFFVDGLRIGQFKLHLTNDSGAQVTATVLWHPRYRRGCCRTGSKRWDRFHRHERRRRCRSGWSDSDHP